MGFKVLSYLFILDLMYSSSISYDSSSILSMCAVGPFYSVCLWRFQQSLHVSQQPSAKLFVHCLCMSLVWWIGGSNVHNGCH